MTHKLSYLALTLFACSSGTYSPPVGTTDGATDAASSTGSYKVTGSVGEFQLGGADPSPLKGATITAGTVTATSAADGTYTLLIPKSSPTFSLTVTHDQEVGTIEQEGTLTGDLDRGSTAVVPTGLQDLLTGMLQGFDNKLAVVSVSVIARGACAGANGATIALDPPGSEKVVYLKGAGVGGSSIIDGAVPGALIYNVAIGQAIKFKVTTDPNAPKPDAGSSNGCTQSAFPIADKDKPTITYTGNVSTQAATVGSASIVSYARVYIE